MTQAQSSQQRPKHAGVVLITVPVRITDRAPGAPPECRNFFYDVNQSLAWLAKERQDVQEQLAWREGIQVLLAPLVQ